jgi:hypothetical protein
MCQCDNQIFQITLKNILIRKREMSGNKYKNHVSLVLNTVLHKNSNIIECHRNVTISIAKRTSKPETNFSLHVHRYGFVNQYSQYL